MKEKSLKQHIMDIAGTGGKSTLKKYGRKHFVKMAKIRWAKRNKTKNVK